MATFVSLGEKIDYTPVAATSAGTVVVQGDVLGIAMVDIAAGSLGALSVEGIWAIEKAAESIAIGDKVWWDAANSRVTKTKGTLTVLAGKAVSAAASGDATVRVLLNEGPSA
jgi:predicted RecA/RadA family phage recombinase